MDEHGNPTDRYCHKGRPYMDDKARRWVSIKDPEKDARRKEITAELDQMKARMDKLDHDHYVRGRLSEERYDYLGEQQESIRKALETEAAELARDSDLSALMSDPKTLREVWESSPLDERRELIRCALRRVTIAPAARQGDRTPILKRLTPEWVDGPDKDMSKVAKVEVARSEATRENLDAAA